MRYPDLAAEGGRLHWRSTDRRASNTSLSSLCRSFAFPNSQPLPLTLSPSSFRKPLNGTSEQPIELAWQSKGAIATGSFRRLKSVFYFPSKTLSYKAGARAPFPCTSHETSAWEVQYVIMCVED